MLNNLIYNLIINLYFNKKDKLDTSKWVYSSLSLTCADFFKIVSSYNDKVEIKTNQINRFLEYYNNKSKYSRINLNNIRSFKIKLNDDFSLTTLAPASVFRNIVKLSINPGESKLVIDQDFITSNLANLNHLTIVHSGEQPQDTKDSISLLYSTPTINSIRLKYVDDREHPHINSLTTYFKYIKRLEIIDQHNHSSNFMLLMEQPVPFFDSLQTLKSLEILKLDTLKSLEFRNYFHEFQVQMLNYLVKVPGLKKISLFKSTTSITSHKLFSYLVQSYEALEELEIGAKCMYAPIKNKLKRLSIRLKLLNGSKDYSSFNLVEDIEITLQLIVPSNSHQELNFITLLIANNSKSISISVDPQIQLHLNDDLLNAIKNNNNLQYLYLKYLDVESVDVLNGILNSHSSIRNFYTKEPTIV